MKLSRNTQQRVLSALAILFLITIVTLLGKKFCQYLVGMLGILVIDEIMSNFLNIKRSNIKYTSAQFLYFSLFVFFIFVNESVLINHLVLFSNLVLNLVLLFFLFNKDNAMIKMAKRFASKYHLFLGGFVFLPIYSLAAIMNTTNWVKVILGFLLLSASSDIGGWLVGKNFGRRKLSPAISPNKTVEGALGAIIIASILMSFYWYFVIEKLEPYTPVIFVVFTVIAILGDLVQSKLKRQFNIKDSSALIPGHGGVYDRLDSHLFLAPFFLLALDLNLL